MAQKFFTDSELRDTLVKLPFNKVKILIDYYSQVTGANFNKEFHQIITNSLQNKLEEHGITKACRKCGSITVVKDGKRADGVQKYLCKDCSTRFTLFSGTILEKTNWHWDAWVRTLEMTINHIPLKAMQNVLINDYGCHGINIKTIWLWRHKLIHAIATMETPKLSGIVQIDETFIRESQKGSRSLVTYLPKPYVRKARYGRQPSKLGIMGPEFATVVTAIDNRGYCVCEVSSLGRVTEDLILDIVEKHIDNPAYICTDGNLVYRKVFNVLEIPHYVKPSDYDATLKESGYEVPDDTDPIKAASTRTNNDKILEKLYFAEEIDQIINRGDLNYQEFIQLKKLTGLNLGRVNEFHKDIKNYINKKMTNVSTKYLQDYLGFFAYIRNWRVTNGKYPTSSKDAEQILIDVLKNNVNYTITDVKLQELEMPIASTRYVTLLDIYTAKTRMISNNKYFKFNEEDGVRSFNKRAYLSDQPKSKLFNICKECKVTKYRKMGLWILVNTILKQPNIEDIIFKLISEEQHIKITQEDIDGMNDDFFRI